MLRYLLILLTVIVAVLAVLFDHLWLRVGAGMAIVSALGLLGWRVWEAASQEEEETRSTPEEEPHESLEELGIMDIRPEGEESAEPEASSGSSSGKSRAEEAETASPSSTSGAPGKSPTTDPASESPPPDRTTTPNQTDRTAGPEASPQSVATEDAPVLAPFLQSLRAALGAQTVCLLVQEEVALSYRIEALASTHPRVQRSGTFDTQTPLLTASMSRQSISVRSLTDSEVAVEDLGYYEDPPSVDQLALAPVPQSDESSTSFLLADASSHSDLGRSRARTLLKHFAETVALLAAGEESDEEQAPVRANGGEAVSSSEEAAGAGGEEEDAPRPRREIIAEEMEAAEAASENLALILVHLNRAESIARRGEEAVASAERLFRARLEQISPDHRVERFGELTYGIFFSGGDAVEPWVADLEAEMTQEKGELEGGVSVGVAVWNDPDEDPEALRATATEALHEAYKTGTSTIVT